MRIFEVGRRVWKSISNLGMVSSVELGMCVKLVEAMKMRDYKRLVGKEANKNQLT